MFAVTGRWEGCDESERSAVLDGFGEMGRTNGAAPGEIGDGAGNTQNAVIGPGRKVESLHGGVHQRLSAGIQPGVHIELAATQPGILAALSGVLA